MNMSIDVVSTIDQTDQSSVDMPDDGLNLSVLTSFEEVQGEGEPDLIVELIDLYVADAQLRAVAMHEALSRKDEPSLKAAAHGLKGSSANLGARLMSEICDELEHTDWSSSFHKLGPLLNQLEQESARVCQLFLAERVRRS